MGSIASRISAALLALCILLFDTLSPLEGAVAVLYVLVFLLAAGAGRRSDIVVAASGCLTLTFAAYVDTHGLHQAGTSTLRALVSMAATTIATLLALKNQSSTERLGAQAQLLNLSHDMIFVRDPIGRITFWNRAAEKAYGGTSAEAAGRIADELLDTRYALPRSEVDHELYGTGRWDGTLGHRTKTGARITVESRWALQRDANGQVVGIFETNTDVTESKAAHAALVRSERRYRRMFDASRIGVVQEDWSRVRAELAEIALPEGTSLSDARSIFHEVTDRFDLVHRKSRVLTLIVSI